MLFSLVFNICQKAKRSYQKDVANLQSRDSNADALDDQESKYQVSIISARCLIISSGIKTRIDNIEYFDYVSYMVGTLLFSCKVLYKRSGDEFL